MSRIYNISYVCCINLACPEDMPLILIEDTVKLLMKWLMIPINYKGNVILQCFSKSNEVILWRPFSCLETYNILYWVTWYQNQEVMASI